MLEVGEQSGHIARFFNNGTRSYAYRAFHLIAQDQRQGGFAQPRGSAE